MLRATTHDTKVNRVMSESETAAATQRKGSLLVRSAEPADHEAIRGLVLGAHAEHAGQLAPEVFSRYLAGSSTWAHTPVTGACSWPRPEAAS